MKNNSHKKHGVLNNVLLLCVHVVRTRKSKSLTPSIAFCVMCRREHAEMWRCVVHSVSYAKCVLGRENRQFLFYVWDMLKLNATRRDATYDRHAGQKERVSGSDRERV